MLSCLLDANVFVEAAKLYYAFDLAPSFWKSLVEQARKGNIRSTDKVRMELGHKDDKLKEWANSDFAQWFETTYEEDLLKQYRKIMKWAISGDFKERTKNLPTRKRLTRG